MAERKNQGKVKFCHFPRHVIAEACRAMMVGEGKYAFDDWRTPPYFEWNTVSDCLERHLLARESGEKFDQESGLLHTAHAACNALIMLYYDMHDLWGTSEPHDYNTIAADVVSSWQTWLENLTKSRPLVAGDRVRIVNDDEFTGQVGELLTIDEGVELPYCVNLEGAPVWFYKDQVERVNKE